jgi:hypothetical protein
MASARGANSASDGYSRFNDDIDNIEGSYQSNNISKLPEYLFILIALFIYHLTHFVLWVSRPTL